MLKICHITSVHPWNDTRIYLKMCRSLAGIGYQVSLIVLEQDKPIPTGDHEGVDVVGVSGAGISNRFHRATRGAYRVVRAAKRMSPDIVHMHDPELIPWIPYLRFHKIKVIFDAHEDFVAQNASRNWAGGWKKFPVFAIARILKAIVNYSANRVITATETIAKQHPKHRTVVVNNYPIEGELVQTTTSQSKLSERPARAIYVGGMNKIRGLVEVIEAADLCEELEGLDLVGSFESMEFENYLRSLPGWRKVTFHGQCDRRKVSELLSNSRIGVVTFHPLPNHIDAKPNKIFEYMSAGLAVLHSDFPLWRTLSQAPSRGLAADPEDSQNIARKMSDLLTRADLDAMGVRATLAVQSDFNWKQEAKVLASVVNSLNNEK